MRAAVVRRSDGAESLLASSVPDLQFDGLAVQVDGADFEVHTDRGNVALSVSVVCESKEQARLEHGT